MDVGTRVELECSYGAGDGRTRSGVASMPKERSGGPRLDRSCDWKSMDMTLWHKVGDDDSQSDGVEETESVGLAGCPIGQELVRRQKEVEVKSRGSG